MAGPAYQEQQAIKQLCLAASCGEVEQVKVCGCGGGEERGGGVGASRCMDMRMVKLLHESPT